MNPAEAARAWTAAGAAVCPPSEDGSKRPIGDWKSYQSSPPTPEEVDGWYGGDRHGIGIVTGRVSNIEVLDFDEAAIWPEFVAAAHAVGLGELVDRVAAGYLERTPNGVHLLWRCPVIEGNRKLAQRPKRREEMRDDADRVKTTIETRGEGGYIVIAPSHGPVHESGRPYEVVAGSPSTVATITPEERASLLAIASTFDQLPARPVAEPTPTTPGDRPGDRLNASASWGEVLTGWREVYRRGETTYWRRPGKDRGVSATTGHTGNDTLIVFSTSTPFEPSPSSYSKFAAWTTLHHGGDFTAAARALREKEYGGTVSTHPIERPADPQDAIIVAEPAAPAINAGIFLKAAFDHAERPRLVRQQGEFRAWDGRAWPALEVDALRAQLYEFFGRAVYQTPLELRPFQPTRSKIDNIVDALGAQTHLNASVTAPAWLASAPVPANEVIALANGLLHVPTRQLLPHSPRFFSPHALPFAFDPVAPPPDRWLRFMGELWPTDCESVETLQEMFGYVLAGDTSQQKIFLIVGPRRSGKGTIARILTALVGREAVAGPTLTSLAERFGLWPLIDRPLAIIGDARVRDGLSTVTERLLSISGEDTITVDRKQRSLWSGRLPTRLVILTNELPRLSDASGALPSRIVLLQMTRSFYGVEDTKLTATLEQELPAIFNWALEGLDRLRARGHFVQPESSAQSIQELEDLASPISAFLRERCAVGPNESVAQPALYEAWRAWCRDAGRDHPGTIQAFGRDLRANVPTLAASRPRDAGNRIRTYVGVGLAEESERIAPRMTCPKCHTQINADRRPTTCFACGWTP